MNPTHSDRSTRYTYGAAMELGQPFIRLKLDIDQPIELGDFVSAFTSLGAEYDRYVRDRHPDFGSDATLYVKEVSKGSIIADLVPWAAAAWTVATTSMDQIMVVEDFVKRYGGILQTYLRPGGRVPDAPKSALRDWTEQVSAIANNPGSKLEMAALSYENGDTRIHTAFKFDTKDAREIQQRVEEHKAEIEHKSGVDRTRVLMTFTRSDIRSTTVGKRSGELVRIGDESDKSLPLIYASELAEQQIKHEISDAEDNVYKKGFVVDVNVEVRNGRPLAYKVTNLHQVIDLPEED